MEPAARCALSRPTGCDVKNTAHHTSQALSGAGCAKLHSRMPGAIMAQLGISLRMAAAAGVVGIVEPLAIEMPRARCSP